MANPEAPRTTREQLIAAKFQMLRDAVYGLANFKGSKEVQVRLVSDGNLAIGGLGLVRVTAGEHETFSGEEKGWESRQDYGIGVLRELTEEHLVYSRDGRIFRAPVGQIIGIRREVSMDSAPRDENGDLIDNSAKIW